MTLVSDAQKIFRAGVAAVEPGRAVRRNLRRRGSVLRVGTVPLRLGRGGSVRLVAIGKAAGAMLDAAARVVGPTSPALAVTPRGFPGAHAGLPTLFGEHPVPRDRQFPSWAAALPLRELRRARGRGPLPHLGRRLRGCRTPGGRTHARGPFPNDRDPAGFGNPDRVDECGPSTPLSDQGWTARLGRLARSIRDAGPLRRRRGRSRRHRLRPDRPRSVDVPYCGLGRPSI